MKLYDKAYTEAPSKKDTDYYMDKMGDNFPLKEHTDVIMLSIEELKEMWDECREETWQDARPTTKYEKPTRLPGFEGYIESKGFTIKQQ